MSFRNLLFSAGLILLLNPITNAQIQPAQYVNPFIGTGGHGHTFPGATVPFGMVQLSPDTRLEGWDGCGGYHYSDEYVYGFSHTHLSGTGIPDYGDILLMPFTGNEYWNNGYNGEPGYRSKFTHADESASPGYYKVKLLNSGISVQLSASARAGMHSYSYNKGDIQKVIIDLEHRDQVTNSWLKVVSDNELEGYRGSRAWAEDQRLYFVIRFSQPIKNKIFALNNKQVDTTDYLEGTSVKAIIVFGEANGEPLLVKVGISAVSAENARLNLDTEIQDWDFDLLKNNARNLWNNVLGKIEVESMDNDKLTVFYTSLYHTMVSPNIFNDVDGSILGRDFKTHKVDHDYYTVFSLWDTYRALHPLMTIIDQKRTNDFIKTFIRQYEDGGLLPVWELSSNETYCMIGYHAVPVIADAYIKGIREYDSEKALNAMLKSARQDMFGLKYYKEFGFTPADREHESVSKTLEYSYDDWCIGSMAELMGKTGVADTFMIRAQGYKHLFDPATGFMRARYNGSWFIPFDAREVNFNYTEANSWQYSFYVPHDMNNFIKLHGGKKGLESKLDGLFTAPSETTGREQSDITGLIGQYAHGNEPSHHIAYLYNYAGVPWKTQEKINFIINNFYTNSPDGLIGNEDCGQMSAWAVFSSLGFYPVCPGSTQYAIGKPQFSETTINLENGRKFIIRAENLSESNIYIQSAELNGKAYSKSYLLHEDVINGGILSFIMDSKPSGEWGIGKGNEPITGITSTPVLAAPVIDLHEQLFDESALVSIVTEEGAIIRFTSDGSEPDENSTIYDGPFKIHDSKVIKFKGYKTGNIPTSVQTARYIKRPQGLNLTLNSEYAPQYSGAGRNTLVDGIKGSEDFRLGGWQGYQGVDLVADIEIKNDKPVKSVSIGFFQDINAWIFMPEKVELWASIDGKEYKLVNTVSNDIPDNQWGVILREFSFPVDEITERYIKIKAHSIKQCPEHHKGKGYPAWIFTDEISVGY
jgi:predicted alpha-1,2-mannosidase